jgi:hypothetical protein
LGKKPAGNGSAGLASSINQSKQELLNFGNKQPPPKNEMKTRKSICSPFLDVVCQGPLFERTFLFFFFPEKRV